MENQTKKIIIRSVLLTILISALTFGTIGYFLGQKNNTKEITTNNLTPSPIQVSPTPISLKTYTSKLEKMSFQYPSDWTVLDGPVTTYIGDSIKIQSPSGKLEVVWISGVEGLGGGCDEGVVLGHPGGCPLIVVLEKQKLDQVDLYYVAYLTTHDGINYSPSMDVVDPTGILTTQRSLGVMPFTGKINLGEKVDFAIYFSARPVAKHTFSETDAKAFLQTPEALQAKNILLSASY